MDLNFLLASAPLSTFCCIPTNVVSCHVGEGLLFSSCDGVSCCPDWTWTGYAAENHLDLLTPPASVSPVLEL